jgi:hypothetical protein
VSAAHFSISSLKYELRAGPMSWDCCVWLPNIK